MTFDPRKSDRGAQQPVMTTRSSAQREIRSEDLEAGPRLVGSKPTGDLGDAPPRGAAGGSTLQGLASSFAARPALLLVALFVYALAFQGSRGLWEPDEGRYTAVALEMERLSD